jgi:hypothetical protein
MRVLIIGRSKQLISAESGLRAAMKRMGHSVIIVDDRKLRQRIGERAGNRWIRMRMLAFKPDRVLFFKNFDTEIETFRFACERYPTCMWYRDLTPPPDPRVPALIARARYVEDVFLTAGEQASIWQAGGVMNTMWLPNAADRDLDRQVPPDPRFACDIAFMGRGISPGIDYSRSEFLVQLSRKYHVRVWGQQWDRWAKDLNWDGRAAYGADFARVCSSAKIVLDIQPALWAQAGFDQMYSSNRMVKVMACGGFCLAQGGYALQRLFRDGQHCGWYQTNDEAFAQIDRFMADERLRENARGNGQQFVRAHHMMENRVHNLLTGEPYRNPLEAQ